MAHSWIPSLTPNLLKPNTKSIDAALAAIVSSKAADDLATHALSFKQDARGPNETGKVLAATAACLTNADGGTMVLGVQDTPGGPDAILEIEHTADWCRQRIHELTSPSVLAKAREILCEGRVLVHLDVPRGIDVREADGRFTFFYRRRGSGRGRDPGRCRVSSGHPVLAGTGLATELIAEHYKADESVEELAKDYGREESAIEEAVRCELGRAA